MANQTEDKPKIGVLALQGDFHAHLQALGNAGANVSEVRTAADLIEIDGLVIPGGESTTMLKLIELEGLFKHLVSFGKTKPIFGTCAGAILLATEVLNPSQSSLGLMDLTVERNGYGRQIDSSIVALDVEGKKLEAVFIRAPIIRRVGPAGKVLASHDGTAVLVEQGSHMVATFHPELTSDLTVHRHFVEKVSSHKAVR